MTSNHTKPEWAQGRRDKENAERVAQGLKPKRRIAPFVILAAVVAIGVAGLAISGGGQKVDAVTAQPAEVTKQIRRSETTQILPTTLRQLVKVTGTLAPASQSDVAAQIAGRVVEVMVRPGDPVQQGDLLVRFDAENLTIQLDQQRATAEATRAQLVSSEQTLERTENLARQDLATPSALEQARSSTAALRSNLSALENAVKSAELAVANATVRAPVGGTISSRSVEPGHTVNVGTALFTIVNLFAVEYQASASVSASALVKTGQSVTVTVSGLENESFVGTVTRVNPVAATGTRAVPIYITIANTDGKLRAGMFATGQITVSEKTDALAIPAAALREDGDGPYVLKLEGERVVRQSVEPGKPWDRGRTIEVSGLTLDDVVVSGPLTQLSAGDRFALIED